MREIKFRAWISNQNRMVGWEGDDCVSYFLREMIFDNNVILMQFTGLLDKNGKEIYEGDIVKWNNEKDSVKWGEYNDYEYVEGLECWVVGRCWKENNGTPLSCLVKSGGVSYGRGESTSNGVEVIGNIHENPELLNNK